QGTDRPFAGGGLELLAVYPRQRDGVPLGREGRQQRQVIGPDLDELERLAEQIMAVLDSVHGVKNVGIFRIKGLPNLEFTVDRDKCKRFQVTVLDVQGAIQS